MPISDSLVSLKECFAISAFGLKKLFPVLLPLFVPITFFAGKHAIADVISTTVRAAIEMIYMAVSAFSPNSLVAVGTTRLEVLPDLILLLATNQREERTLTTKQFILAGYIACLFSLSTENGQACSCIRPEVSQAFHEASAVFVGEVIEIVDPSTNNQKRRRSAFHSLQVNTQPDRGSDLWSKMFFYYNSSAKNSWPTIPGGQMLRASF